MTNYRKVCILGAGISAISTAYLLLEKGFEVHIITKDHPTNSETTPNFSSLFPAASIIPHSVHNESIGDLFSFSKQYFEHLYQNNFPGISVTQHYELFTDRQNIPFYVTLMDSFEMLNEFDSDFYPDHPYCNAKSGWRFNAYFADWPVYFPTLVRSVINRVSGFMVRELKPDDLETLPFDIIINCTEIGSIKLFHDTECTLLQRGHLINIPNVPALQSPGGNVVSFNFTPGEDIYCSLQGSLQDVYCYSRKDGLILGGSRQNGTLNDEGEWIGETNAEPEIEVHQLRVPKQMIELNAAIIKHSFGLDLPPISKMRSKLGYRFTRHKTKGLRLESEEIGDKFVIHNYGHGGAGVTLSWGCAQKVHQIIADATNLSTDK